MLFVKAIFTIILCIAVFYLALYLAAFFIAMFFIVAFLGLAKKAWNREFFVSNPMFKRGS